MVVVLVGSAVPVGTPASWEGREVHFVFFFFGFSAFFSAAREFGIQQIWSVGRHSFFEKTLKLAVKVFPICENHQ